MATPVPKEPSLITSGLVVVSVLFPIFSAIAIACRYKARRIGRQSFQADDWWILATWILTFAESLLVWIFAPKIGIDHVKPSLLVGSGVEATHLMLLALFIASSYVQFPLAAVKISILFFYKRIFSIRSFRLVSWFLIVLCGIWGVLLFLVLFLQCDPYASCWNPPVTLRYDAVKLGMAQVGSSIALDVIILCTPIPVIVGLKMNTTRKFAVASIFWLGSFCCIAAIVRLILIKISVAQVVKSSNSIPVQAKNFIFIILESNCSIIAACMPTFGPLFAGGRAPESIIRSVRSVFSIRSSDSSRTRSIQRWNENRVAKDNASTDSNFELRPTAQPWDERHGHGSHAVNATHEGDEEMSVNREDVINVTKAYEVHRQ